MITKDCHIEISPNHIKVNGQEVNIPDGEKSFIVRIYEYLKVDYPKFYKMDNQTKLGFLAVELLLKEIEVQEDFENDLGMLFFNSLSSKEADLKYWEKARLGRPNPSLFVYTLPNIVLGEISIRNKWYGESSFLIVQPEEKNIVDKVMHTWFAGNKVKYCLKCELEYRSDSQYFVNLNFLKANSEK